MFLGIKNIFIAKKIHNLLKIQTLAVSQIQNGDHPTRFTKTKYGFHAVTFVFRSRLLDNSTVFSSINIKSLKLIPNLSKFSYNFIALRYESSVINNTNSSCVSTKPTESSKDKLDRVLATTAEAQEMGKLFSDEECVIKIRGLPWSTTVDEIIKFFEGVNIRNGRAGVQMTTSREGRPSGEAFIEMETEEDVEQALLKDKEHMGRRYIEVFKVKRSEMEWILRHQGTVAGNSSDQSCVRLRGLPFDSTKEDIVNFFGGLDIVPNGITMVEDFSGKSTGEAYVQFVDKDAAETALLKHKEKIGHRYIEIFRSTLEEIRSVTSGGDYIDKMRSPFMGQGFGRPTPYSRNDRFGGSNRFGGGMRGPRGGNFRGGGFPEDKWDEPSGPGWNNMGGGGGGMGSRGGRWGNDSGPMGFTPPGSHVVHMRGLPFRASESDIADFFKPINPVNIIIQFENSGRPSGEADVEFSSHEDAVQAMSKDKSNMQHRYIELFLNSSGGSGGGRGNMGGFSGPSPSEPMGRFGPMFDRRPNRMGGGRPEGNFRNSFFDY